MEPVGGKTKKNRNCKEKRCQNRVPPGWGKRDDDDENLIACRLGVADGNEKEKRKEEVRISVTVRNTMPIPGRGILRHQLLQQATLAPLLPPNHSNGDQAAIWAATLTPSQAGATFSAPLHAIIQFTSTLTHAQQYVRHHVRSSLHLQCTGMYFLSFTSLGCQSTV